MDVKIPDEDFASLKQHINDSVRDSIDFMNKLASKSQKCTQKAYDNVPFLVFSHILYKEIQVLMQIIESFEIYSDSNFPTLTCLPFILCHKIDKEINITNIKELNLFVVHIVHQIILEYTEFMKIMYLENYDYEHYFTSDFFEKMSDIKLAEYIVRVLTFTEHDFEGLSDVRLEHLLTCMDKNKKTKMDTFLVFTKMNNMIITISNLHMFLIQLYRSMATPCMMFARLKISDSVDYMEDAS